MAIFARDLNGPHASEAGHWYTRLGDPAYTIVGKNGKSRAMTLRDARVLRLVPSVSMIAGMEAKPGLVKWQVEQALMSALTLPRLIGETDDAFKDRALDDSKQQAIKAAERGTELHAAIEGHFQGDAIRPRDQAYVVPVVQWLYQRFPDAARTWEPERSFAHRLGYGGKCDLRNLAVPLVIDFKCKSFGPEKQAKDLAYPEHCTQLAAYAEGFGMKAYHGINIFVSTLVPGLIRVREWDAVELADGWAVFQCFLRAWQIRRTFDTALAEVAVA